MDNFQLKTIASLSSTDATLSSCFITIHFNNQSNTTPYHSEIYIIDALNLLAGMC